MHSCRDQKTIDIENRANYVALAQRWEVLDVTIQIPEEEMSKSIPVYMEDSEDEGDCGLSSPDNQTEKTGNPRNTDEPSSVENPEKSQPSDSNLTGDCCGVNCSQGESTGSAVTDVQHSPHVQAALPRSQCGGSQVESSGDDGQCSGEACDHINGRVPSSSSLQSQGDPQTGSGKRCSCHCRQKSSSGVLDEEGQALLNILEFPSKVLWAVQMYSNLPKCMCACNTSLSLFKALLVPLINC